MEGTKPMTTKIVQPWIETFTGAFTPMDPKAGDVRIEDIAHALSLKCRFNGHCRVFYSVAEHSVRLSELVKRFADGRARVVVMELQRIALLHDAAEAYLCDVPRPIKDHLKGFKAVEMLVESAVAARFGVKWPWPRELKKLDYQLCLAEAAALMPSGGKDWETYGLNRLEIPIVPWSAAQAEEAFLGTWRELSREGAKGEQA
jgi:hypothetical protein